MNFDYLMVGGSAGSVSAVEAIRSVDKNGTIALIHREEVPGYSRPLITEVLAGEMRLDGILFRNGGFWETSRVHLIHDEATFIDVDDRTVTLLGGKKVGYGKILLAVGGKPIMPRLDCTDVEVHSFTSISDVERLRSALYSSDRVVVIGGGLIGVGLSDALCRIGKKVTVVELKDRIIPNALDSEGASILQGAMGRWGVNLVLGRSVEEICRRSGGDIQVKLDNGETLIGDLVVAAIGVKPETRLAAEAGAAVDLGIEVEETMRTSVPELYACGDAAEVYDYIRGDRRPLPQWPVARGTGKIAGLNMAGVESFYEGSTTMNAFSYFNTPIITAGENSIDRSYTVVSRLENGGGVYRRFVLKEDVIVGFALVGDVERAGLFLRLMKHRAELGQLKRELCSSDFMLTSLPKRLRVEVLS
ncbi:MAG: FAD-dependent oxidoreductase [Candidatus Bathyarchaeia archaeon]